MAAPEATMDGAEAAVTSEAGAPGAGEVSGDADAAGGPVPLAAPIPAAPVAGVAAGAPGAGGSSGGMNVLYLNHVGQISGAEQSLRALLWQFRRMHAEVEPVIALPCGGPLADLLRDEEWTVTFAPLRRLKRPDNLLGGMATVVHVLRTTPFLTRLIYQTRSHLVHSNSTLAHLVGGMAADRADRPALWHARDLTVLGHFAPALARRATWVIAISGCVAERLQKDGVPPEKIRIIYNGLDPDEWTPRQGSRLRESLGIPDGAFLFGCAGQLVPWKNQTAFIEAAHRLSQEEGCDAARFVIMGGDLWDENEGYVAELRALVKSYGLQDRFNFVPHQINNVDALAAFDALVLCSHEEPFGRVLIEAMALGKPVIAYAENGPLEIITHLYDGVLVPAAEAEGMAGAIRNVLRDPALRESLGRHARQTVVERFHIADHAQRVLEIYREVLS